ncbi:hypothetical protein [Escherichia phage dw-ec]|nr:hypothetical protein [Escherichia phage BI-EHEC]UJQ43844.1 hypothetical protein [Escherichia phage dw-ec]
MKALNRRKVYAISGAVSTSIILITGCFFLTGSCLLAPKRARKSFTVLFLVGLPKTIAAILREDIPSALILRISAFCSSVNLLTLPPVVRCMTEAYSQMLYRHYPSVSCIPTGKLFLSIHLLSYGLLLHPKK